MRKQVLGAVILALAFTSLPAAAADNGVYIGASAGRAGVKDDELSFDADATGYKVIAGWRFLDWLSVEANYVDFGSADDTILGEPVTADADGLSLSAVGFLAVGPVDLFARVGAINWDARITSPDFEGFRDDGTDLTYGVGAQFRVWSLSLRAEYEVFDLPGADVDMISLGVTWTFL